MNYGREEPDRRNAVSYTHLEMYISFVCGELEVWDLETGEIFNHNDFTDKNGDPKELSESTIRNILNKPANQDVYKRQW